MFFVGWQISSVPGWVTSKCFECFERVAVTSLTSDSHPIAAACFAHETRGSQKKFMWQIRFHHLDIYIYIYIYIYICIYIHWVVPPPRMPVTTRITMFLAGDPYKSEFATVARRGDNPRYILKSTWWLGARIPNDTWFQVGFMILMFKRNEPRFNCFMLWCAPRLIGDAGFSMLFCFF